MSDDFDDEQNSIPPSDIYQDMYDNEDFYDPREILALRLLDFQRFKDASGELLNVLRLGILQPTPDMSPHAKGQLLLRYVQKGETVAGLDFAHSNLSFVNLCNAYLSSVSLSWADLHGAAIRDADLTDANLLGVDLSGADLTNSVLTGANIRNAKLSGANLENADLRSADLTDSSLTNTPVRNALCDAATYARSGWTPETLAQLHMRGLKIHDLDEFPKEAQYSVTHNSEGLTLYFNTRITPFDRFLVDNVVFAVLGPDTDCRIESFDQTAGRAVVKLVAAKSEDLFAVADALTRRLWEATAREQTVVNNATVHQQLNAAGDILIGDDTRKLAEEIQALRIGYEEQLRMKESTIVVLQGRLADALSELIDRINRITWRPMAGAEGEERSWEVIKRGP